MVNSISIIPAGCHSREHECLDCVRQVHDGHRVVANWAPSSVRRALAAGHRATDAGNHHKAISVAPLLHLSTLTRSLHTYTPQLGAD